METRGRCPSLTDTDDGESSKFEGNNLSDSVIEIVSLEGRDLNNEQFHCDIHPQGRKNDRDTDQMVAKFKEKPKSSRSLSEDRISSRYLSTPSIKTLENHGKISTIRLTSETNEGQGIEARSRKSNQACIVPPVSNENQKSLNSAPEEDESQKRKTSNDYSHISQLGNDNSFLNVNNDIVDCLKHANNEMQSSNERSIKESKTTNMENNSQNLSSLPNPKISASIPVDKQDEVIKPIHSYDVKGDKLPLSSHKPVSITDNSSTSSFQSCSDKRFKEKKTTEKMERKSECRPKELQIDTIAITHTDIICDLKGVLQKLIDTKCNGDEGLQVVKNSISRYLTIQVSRGSEEDMKYNVITENVGNERVSQNQTVLVFVDDPREVDGELQESKKRHCEKTIKPKLADTLKRGNNPCVSSCSKFQDAVSKHQNNDAGIKETTAESSNEEQGSRATKPDEISDTADKPSDTEKVNITAEDIVSKCKLSNVKKIFKMQNINHVLLNQPHDENEYKEKAFILLGTSGSGKTTLIKLIASYYSGIKSPEDFLSQAINICPEISENGDGLTAYTAFDSSDKQTAITIIDTPGLDKSEEVQSFLTNALAQGFNIHAIGYVIQARVSRLTPAEKLVMEFVKTNFKNNPDNIIPLITFSDSQGVPPVFKALESYGIETEKKYLFNNSILSLTGTQEEEVHNIDRRHWKKGMKNWSKIAKSIMLLCPIPYHQEIQNTITTASKTKERQLSGTLDSGTETSKDRQSSGMDSQSSSNLNMEKKSIALTKLETATSEFATVIDKTAYINENVKELREEVWKRAQIAYTYVYFKSDVPFDMWVYDITGRMISSSGRNDIDKYLNILAFSLNKPLVNVGFSIIQNSLALYNFTQRSCSKYYCFFAYHEEFHKMVIKKALHSINIALKKFHVHSFLGIHAFLHMLMEQCEDHYHEYICVLLKNVQ